MIINLNVKPKHKKLLEDNIGENIGESGLRDVFVWIQRQKQKY